MKLLRKTWKHIKNVHHAEIGSGCNRKRSPRSIHVNSCTYEPGADENNEHGAHRKPNHSHHQVNPRRNHFAKKIPKLMQFQIPEENPPIEKWTPMNTNRHRQQHPQWVSEENLKWVWGSGTKDACFSWWVWGWRVNQRMVVWKGENWDCCIVPVTQRMETLEGMVGG